MSDAKQTKDKPFIWSEWSHNPMPAGTTHIVLSGLQSPESFHRSKSAALAARRRFEKKVTNPYYYGASRVIAVDPNGNEIVD